MKKSIMIMVILASLMFGCANQQLMLIDTKHQQVLTNEELVQIKEENSQQIIDEFIKDEGKEWCKRCMEYGYKVGFEDGMSKYCF